MTNTQRAERFLTDTVLTTVVALVVALGFLALQYIGAHMTGTDSTKTAHVTPTASATALPSTGPATGGAVIAPDLTDVGIEGVDVLIFTVDDTPADLWDALSRTYPEWYSEHGADDSGEGAFYVPVGTKVHTPGHSYIAMPNEMLGCEDWVTTGAECGLSDEDIAAYFNGTGPLTLWHAV